MKIHTKYFGETEINQEEVITFPQGLPGFDQEKQFVLLNLEDNPVFKVLQSVSTPAAAFIVADPFSFTNEFEFKLDDPTLTSLEIDSEEDVAVYVVLSIKEPFDQSTMNLQAPIIINQSRKKARQYILNDQKYSIRTPLTTSASAEKED